MRSKRSLKLYNPIPKTDWSKVNIDALRQHLIDMNEVTLRAAATPRVFDDGIEFTVTGEGRTLEAIKRMVPAHVNELREIGWNAKSDELPNGVKLAVTANEGTTAHQTQGARFYGDHGARWGTISRITL